MHTDNLDTRHPTDPRPAQLVEAIRACKGLKIRPRGAPYGHMGATITDAALQAGWNYTRTVLPRVKHVLKHYRDADTTSKFRDLIAETGNARTVLQTHHAKKVAITQAFATQLADDRVETEEQLRIWIACPSHRELLRAIPGVGRKTAAYLALLSGARDYVAVDVHLRRFLHETRVEADGDAEAVFIAAAHMLGEARVGARSIHP